MINLMKKLSEIGCGAESQHISNLLDGVVRGDQDVCRFFTKDLLADAVWGLAGGFFDVVIQQRIAYLTKLCVLRNGFVRIFVHMTDQFFVYVEALCKGR